MRSAGSKIDRLIGLSRSIAIYRGIPGRAARLRRFYKTFIAPGNLCFDVGAHVGNHTRCWRQLGARVVAIEPQADFARLLRTLFGRDRAVTVLEMAVGRTSGRAMLNASERTPTVSSLSRAWIEQVSTAPGFAQVAWTQHNEVAVTTLTDLIERYGFPCFVKIDVEGFEPDVLHGLDCALPALSFEIVPAVRAATIECINRLGQLGDYEFNLSFGERYQFDEPRWRSAPEIREQIVRLATGSGSGDVYARRLAGR